MNTFLEEDSDYVKVFVNGLLHVHFLRKYYRGLSSYNNGIYTIEILLKDQKLRLEYDKRSDWENMLDTINQAV